MPRWKALPEELDPHMREFVGQLRQLVDGGGLSLAAVADRTGYSKASWERYLNGRLLAPRGATVALAEVTGTQQHPLMTLWELAERAWSRSDMRHELTMEAIRISQARAALGEAGVAPAPVAGRCTADGGTAAPTAELPGGRAHDEGRPQQEPVHQAAAARVPRPGRPEVVPGAGGGASRTGAGPGEQRNGGHRGPAVFLAGLVGALTLTVGAVLLVDAGRDDDAVASAARPSATTPPVATPSAVPATSAPRLPAGVGCGGAGCTGQDPEGMGCGGRFAGTVARATVGGGLVEVRYSEICGAAWARITQVSPGDTVKITVGPSVQVGRADAEAEAYTPMVAVEKPSDAEACAALASGATGCATAE
ncbi:DUF2690 domain-containing protein [Streptomyces sp. NPDC058008]|uniref:helix-turn-helix domain-containing protein n=1 Tax=Streptomyces sp. NPDC058008 TaxID=3346303 RepID=UPI0036EC7B02